MAEQTEHHHPNKTHPFPPSDVEIVQHENFSYSEEALSVDDVPQVGTMEGVQPECAVGVFEPKLALGQTEDLTISGGSTIAADTTMPAAQLQCLSIDEQMRKDSDEPSQPTADVLSFTTKFVKDLQSYSEEKRNREQIRKQFLYDVGDKIRLSEQKLEALKELWEPIVKCVVDQLLEVTWIQSLGKMIDEMYGNDLDQWGAVQVKFLHVSLSILCSDEAQDVTPANLQHYTSIYKCILDQIPLDLISEALLKGDKQCLLSSIAFNSKRGDIIEYLITDTFAKPKRNAQPQVPLTQGTNEKLLRELNHGSIKQPTICLLNQLLKMYVTSEGKDGAKKHAFVYYNVKGRENDKDASDSDKTSQQPEGEADVVGGQISEEDGKRLKEKKELEEAKGSLCEAEMEADTVISWLRDANFVYDGRQDWTVNKLPIKLEEHVKEIKDKCSVVVVFLMAHGELDCVQDVDGETISLTKLDDIINGAIPDYIPKIFIVQACQVVEPAVSKRAPKSDTWWKQVRGAALNMAESVTGRAGAAQPVEQTREVGNTKHFVRVMAAAEGQKAYRNEFLPLLIEQLKEGLDFLKAFDNTAKRLDSSTPEIKKKTLVNPVYLDKGARC